jgi:pilus assembly protein Flp/PilA
MTTLQTFVSPFRHFLRDENGATAIEYALIATGIAAAIITTVYGLGPKLNSKYESVSSALPN